MRPLMPAPIPVADVVQALQRPGLRLRFISRMWGDPVPVEVWRPSRGPVREVHMNDDLTPVASHEVENVDYYCSARLAYYNGEEWQSYIVRVWYRAPSPTELLLSHASMDEVKE